MTQQNNSNSGGNSNSNPGGGNRRPQNSNPNRRRPSHHQNRDNRGPRPQGQQGQQQGAASQSTGSRPAQPQREGQNQGQNRQQGQNQNRRRFNNQNRNRPQGQGRPQQHQHAQSSAGFNIDRIYEKYLNLLDQHLIARRKYHDLFYRAEPAQKIKLEKNFYNTLNDIRDFESRLAPDVKDLFEKRNNGYQYDRTYTSNHEIPVEGELVASDVVAEDPHLLQSQIQANYMDDTEESVGSLEDYLKYKN